MIRTSGDGSAASVLAASARAGFGPRRGPLVCSIPTGRLMCGGSSVGTRAGLFLRASESALRRRWRLAGVICRAPVPASMADNVISYCVRVHTVPPRGVEQSCAVRLLGGLPSIMCRRTAARHRRGNRSIWAALSPPPAPWLAFSPMRSHHSVVTGANFGGRSF